MPEALRIEVRRRPSAVGNMARALYPSAGLAKAGRFPSIIVSWTRHRVDRRHLGTFLGLMGLEASGHLPLPFPHVVSFHLLQHRRIAAGEVLDLETRVAGQRILEKGAEVDLYSTVRAGAEVVWESLNTFYYRGRSGLPGEASPLARSPEGAWDVFARWRMPSGTGRRFGGLTGDYNGIHLSSWYARLFGFKGAFLHPQLSLGLCMARLAGREAPERQRLDAWLKGPVYYASAVTLRAAVSESDCVFALLADEDERPRIVGRWRSANTGHLIACPSRADLLSRHTGVK